ncbi:hypothetical protein LBMAG56_27130 [Verrucomicrobiota bacterium]|nr:hypothetical protein LBMAG56_27130 [Verrucomicrobiota bacterium]
MKTRPPSSRRAAIALFIAFLALTTTSLRAQTDDLAPLSDEFANAATLANFTRLYTVEGWGVNRLTTYDINTSRPGALVMVPRASGWYQDYQGELAFKNVTGNFVVTTEVGVTNIAGTGAPGANYAFAGVLVRAPRPAVTSPATWTAGGENWVVQGVGAAGSPGSYSYEQKDTINSVTTTAFPAGGGRATLQMARLGNALLVLRQPAGGAWAVVARYPRADFPATLQVGLSAMGNYSAASALTPLQHNQTVITAQSADLVATFDYFRLQRPVVPANLQGLDFTNPAQVSDAQLLAFLGANANSAPATGSAGTLQFSAATYSVAENAGTATITVTRTGGATGAVGVSFATANGTATAGSDYTGASSSLNWAAGDAAAKTFAVTITNDTAVEGAETVNLSLSAPTGGATLGSPATATLTIVDDDVAPFTDDLAALSDEFDNAATLGDFQRVFQVEGWGAGANKLQTFNINTSRPGRLVMIPYTSSWYNNYVGELAFKNITGDFVITTETLPRNRAQTGAPGGQYSLSGIMVRAPSGLTTGAAGWQTGRQNYVFLSHGAANNPGTYQFEVKTTLNSASTLYISNNAPAQGEIQVARLGGSLIMLRRDNGGQWLVHRRYSRPDFPATLQAGLTVYTDWQGLQAVYPFGQELAHNAGVVTGQNPDLRAEFEYLRYHRPQIPANLAGRDFADPAQVTDAELLAFLGTNANAPGTSPPGLSQPVGAVLVAGTNHTFSVTATGAGPFTYQWLRNTVPLPDATNSTLTLTAVTRASSGNYAVQVTGPGGASTSVPAILRVLNFPRLHPPQRLGDGSLRLRFNDHDGGLLTPGDAPYFEVWASAELPATNWIRLPPSLTLTNGILTLDDPDAPLHPRRFYRVLER